MFQLDGGPMQDLLRRMVPTSFEDISTVLALYRPGPMGVNAHNDYADRKNGRQEVRPIHPEQAEPLADILDETFGLIVYQEQVMAIAQRVAGYSLGEADLLRRAMSKKKKEILDKEYETFSGGMRDACYSAAAIKTLWDILLPFSDYASIAPTPPDTGWFLTGPPTRKCLYLVHGEAIDAVMESKRAEAIGQFDLFGGPAGIGVEPGLFDVPVPAEVWDTTHQLALDREMLGLSVSGHPPHGVDHILARQSADLVMPDLAQASAAQTGRRGMNHRVTSDSFTSDT